MFRLIFKNTDNRVEVNDLLYESLDKELGSSLGLGKDTHERAYLTKFILSEIIDNFYPSDDPEYVKDYDKEFSRGTLEFKISSSAQIEVTLQHDGNDFDPFDPANKCDSIIGAATKINFKPKNISIPSSSPTVRRGFSIKFNLKDNG